MVLWKFTLREIRNRPGRATLTLLSIVIGMAGVVAVHVATNTSHNAYREMFEKVTGRASLEVVAEGSGTYDEAVAAQVRGVSGVKSATPIVQEAAILYVKEKRVRLMAMGMDPAVDAETYGYKLAGGRYFQKGGGALLEASLARALGVPVGGKVKLLTHKGVQQASIVGTLAPSGMGGFYQAGVIFLPMKTAQFLFTGKDMINGTSIVVDDGADEKTVREEIAKVLPAGLRVRSPAARTQLAQNTLQDVEQGLKFAYVTILLVAVFVILNTFLMNVGERRRQMAILRAIGATRGQIMRMLLTEGFFMAVVGTALGGVVGLGGAYVLTMGMSKLYAGAPPAIRITPGPFIIIGILGPALAMLAVYFPARIAGTITPLEGMRPVPEKTTRRTAVACAVFGAVLYVIAGTMLAASIFGWLPIDFSIYVGVVFTGALVLLIPIMMDVFAKIVSPLISPVFKTEGRIAQRQVLRKRVRSGLTIGVLYVALSLAIGLGTMIMNNVADVRDWQAQTMVGDFFVRAAPPDLSSGASVAIPETFRKTIQDMPGVTSVDSIQLIKDARVAGQSVFAIAMDFASERLTLDLKEGERVDVRKRLKSGEVVLGTVLAHRAGLHVGDEVPVDTREGPQRLRVAGLATDYMVGGLVVYMNRQTAKRLFHREGADVFLINAAPKAQRVVEAKLRKLADENGWLLQSFAELRKNLDKIMTPVIAGLWGLVVLAFVVAGFGIANTLTMNVLEQTRELALLRVVAMTRAQVRKTIIAQAAFLGVIGLTIGVIGGVLGSFVINATSLPLLGRPIEFAWHPWLLVAGFFGALAIVLIAAWLPAERATRLNLLIALQYE